MALYIDGILGLIIMNNWYVLINILVMIEGFSAHWGTYDLYENIYPLKWRNYPKDVVKHTCNLTVAIFLPDVKQELGND